MTGVLRDAGVSAGKEQWQELKMKGAYGATPPEAEELPPPDEEN